MNCSIENNRENALAINHLAINHLAREQMKLKLMQDIRFDIEVCRIEGWEYKQYLQELKGIIDGFLRVRVDGNDR